MRTRGHSEIISRLIAPHLQEASKALDGANVVFYYSNFINAPEHSNLGLCEDDVKGFHSAFEGLDTEKPLVLILNTPGGGFWATDMIVEYIHSRFGNVTAIIPFMAMSGGAAIALSCDKILIAKDGVLGPPDPQIEGHGAAKDIIHTFHPSNSDPDDYILFHSAKRLSELSLRLMENALVRKGKQITEIHKIIYRVHLEPPTHETLIRLSDIQDLDLDVDALDSNHKLCDASTNAFRQLLAITRNTDISRAILNHRGDVTCFSHKAPASP